MSKQLIISIDPDGNIQAEISGVKGSKCMEYLPMIEELLEGKIASSELTGEYYQQETVHVSENTIGVDNTNK